MDLRAPDHVIAGINIQTDVRGAEQLVVSARGVWRIADNGSLALVEEPPPLLPADEHVGEPGFSSVRREADLGPVKLATDCILVGSAVAPKGRAKRVNVSFRVGKSARKAVVVGERRWLFWLLRWWSTPTASFARVPLLWELAEGGSDITPEKPAQHAFDLRNPLGRGVRARGSKLKQAGSPLPQILTPSGCRPFGGRGEPAGFGLTGGHWLPRRKLAGTYDEAWQKERAPLLPLDFDPRFHSAGAPGLVSESPLAGGESVEVTGCTRRGRLSFRLPKAGLDVIATLDRGAEPVALSLATVTVDTDAMELWMLWRGALNVHGRLPRLSRIDVKPTGDLA